MSISIIKTSPRCSHSLAVLYFGIGAFLSISTIGASEAVSPNECFPNGSFEVFDGQNPAFWGKRSEIIAYEKGHAIKLTGNFSFTWDAPDKPIWDADYIFSYRVKAENVSGRKTRLVLWARLPDQHEPPAGGLINAPVPDGTFDWKTQEFRFHMPLGVSRFIVFFDAPTGSGVSYIDDISIRPVNDRPLDVDTSRSFGSTEREPLAWIWSEPGFKFSGQHMGKDATLPAPHQEILFRKTVQIPQGATGPKVVFCGDDQATLWVDEKEIARNEMVQDVASTALDSVLTPGRHTLQFKVVNDLGPGGLIARVEWKNADASRVLVPTNASWECSTDNGHTWKPAAVVAAPAPAPVEYAWCYPHLDKLKTTFTCALPSGITAARIVVRATGGFDLSADGQTLLKVSSSGRSIRFDLGQSLNYSRQLTLTLEDIEQPPAGQATLEIQTGNSVQTLSLADFKSNGNPPTTIPALYPGRTWPLNVAALAAAATRPPRQLGNRLEPWASQLLDGARDLFRIGKADNSSSEFAEIKNSRNDFTLPLANPGEFPRGLESKLRPEVTLRFNLDNIPANGAAFELAVEDSDAIASSVGIFVNGIFCGCPQVIGYDQFPGGRLTNRTWVVTLPPERFITGANTLTLRLLPSYYQEANTNENQAEEYIKLFRLGDRSLNPYPTSNWLHWDTLALRELSRPVTDPVNGRPVWMGASSGYIVYRGLDPWLDYILRDLSYLGMEGGDSPYRISLWAEKKLEAASRGDSRLASGQDIYDYQLASLRARGIRPYLLTDCGKSIKTPDEEANTREAAAIRKYGRYFDMIEIGNEIDHPRYGWDSFALASAYALIQRQAVAAQWLKTLNPQLKVMGEGWYHAWDFSVIDAQARQEAPNDPAWTDHLSAHTYGKSYIIPAITYYMLYGTTFPKPVWVTECGAYTADDRNIGEFELNLRGNLAYATYLVQYLTHPYNAEMRHFSLFSAESKDSEVLEKARCYRRLLHTFALHGKPLPWQYENPAAMKDKLVYVAAVENGNFTKISFVNYEHSPQTIALRVTLPTSGQLTAIRYGDGKTVEAGTRAITLNATPQVSFNDTLAPGETVEYLIRKETR